MNRMVLLGLVIAALVAVPLVSQLGGNNGWRQSDVAFAQLEEGDASSVPGVMQPDEAMIMAQMRLQELEAELQDIQAQVLEEDESLRARATALDQRLFDRMEEVGYEGLGDDLRALEDVFERLQSGEITEQEAQAALEERADSHVRLQEVHQEVLQDEEFAEELARDRQALAEDVVAAMHEKDERTASIIQELEAVEAELTRSLLEGRGEAPAPAPGELPQ